MLVGCFQVRSFILELNLVAFCKTVIEIAGYITVLVKGEEVERKLNIYITEVDRKPLLGREWIRQLSIPGGIPDFLDCNVVDNVNNVDSKKFKLEDVFQKYKEVRSNEWSKISGVQAKLTLIPNATPVFLARTVLFKLVKLLDKELDELSRVGVLEKIETSEWANPIVPILKADGRIRICGDYKATVNSKLIVDEHPLPTINEIFAKLGRKEIFKHRFTSGILTIGSRFKK